MAYVEGVGTPENDTERLVLQALRERLPDSYRVLHSFRIERERHAFEVDLAVLAPHAVYLIEVKGTRGRIESDGRYWYTQGAQHFATPLAKVERNAKQLKSWLLDTPGHGHRMHGVYVAHAVVLPHQGARLEGPDHERRRTFSLEGLLRYLQEPDVLPPWAERDVTDRLPDIRTRLRAGAVEPERAHIFGLYSVEGEASEDGAGLYREYRARHAAAGQGGAGVVLRVYPVDPYLPSAERDAARHRMARAFQALTALPSHAGIVAPREFFSLPDESGFALVLEDVGGRALRPAEFRAAPLEVRLGWIGDLVSALAHAHAHGVVHRALSPAAVLVDRDGRARLDRFDHARPPEPSGRTVLDEIPDSPYAAPEWREAASSAAAAASDVYALGLVLFELLVGGRAFDDSEQARHVRGVFPARPSQIATDLPRALDGWLQSLCAWNPADRPSAAEALAAFESILQGAQATSAAAPARTVDYDALETGFLFRSLWAMPDLRRCRHRVLPLQRREGDLQADAGEPDERRAGWGRSATAGSVRGDDSADRGLCRGSEEDSWEGPLQWAIRTCGSLQAPGKVPRR